MKFKYLYLLAFLLPVLVSCQKEEIRAPFSPTGGSVNMPVQFEPNISGSEYRWDFGDFYVDELENTSKSKNPTHVYKFKGTYKVKLKVYTHKGEKEFLVNVYIN